MYIKKNAEQSMKHFEGQFAGVGPLNLYYQTWQGHKSPKANIVLIHGLGSHSDTFTSVVKALVAQGYWVYGFDLRGHGRSEGQRGYINRWSEFREDLAALLQIVLAASPNCPCFLYGHSLGATITLEYAMHYPQSVQGIILSALPIGKVGLSPVKFLIGRFLSSVWPHFTLKTGIDLSAGSRDPAAVKIRAQDPLRHTYGRARLSTEFFSTIKWLQTHITDLKVPVLMLHGSADRTVPPDGSRLYFEKISFPNKQYIEYPGAFHDLHLDWDSEQVLADVEYWLDQQLSH